MKSNVSIIIPLFNEEDNVLPLTESIDKALSKFPHPWEVIFVDDGSSDTTRNRLREAVKLLGNHASILELQRNFGQTAAMQAGIDEARGDILVTLDGDLQNDPADIPKMVERLILEELDLLVGWRKDRKDNYLLRKLPSIIANFIIGKMSGVKLNDYGCSLKVYRAEIIKSVRIYGEMHRFIPAWMASYTASSRIKEEVVRHNARQHGYSKYGLSRTYRVLLDLLSVYFFMSFVSRPAHFFGRIGMFLGLSGGIALIYLLYVKVFLVQDIGGRPLLLTGIILILMSLQFFCTGILGELMTRTYYEASGKKPYVVRKLTSSAATAWRIR